MAGGAVLRPRRSFVATPETHPGLFVEVVSDRIAGRLDEREQAADAGVTGEDERDSEGDGKSSPGPGAGKLSNLSHTEGRGNLSGDKGSSPAKREVISAPDSMFCSASLPLRRAK